MYKLLHSVGSMEKFRQQSELERLHRILAVILRWRSVSTLKSAGKRTLTIAEVASAKLVWVKWIPKEIVHEFLSCKFIVRVLIKTNVNGTKTGFSLFERNGNEFLILE